MRRETRDSPRDLTGMHGGVQHIYQFCSPLLENCCQPFNTESWASPRSFQSKTPCSEVPDRIDSTMITMYICSDRGGMRSKQSRLEVPEVQNMHRDAGVMQWGSIVNGW